jgi:hypothetical protein
VPELIIKKGLDTEIPEIKDIEILLPYKGKNHKIVSHRTAEDLNRIEEIFLSYRNGKNILSLASDKNYSLGKVTDDKRYDMHVPISGLDRNVKRVTLLFLFHIICCICGSFLALPPATLEIASIFMTICFALLFAVLFYGEFIQKKYTVKEKYSFFALFEYIPIWLKTINILSLIWFAITTQLNVDDILRDWLHIPKDAANTNSRLIGPSMFMLLSSISTANNLSRLLKFKASVHEHSD